MIGVLLRDNDKYTLNKEIKSVIDHYHKICIGVYPNSLEEFIEITKLCDGFILQGGNDYTDLEIEFVRYLYEKNIQRIGTKVKYIVQSEQLGFGHAVYLARKYVKDSPCILVLGDTIYKSYTQKSCVEQLLDFYDEYENVIIALHELKEEELKSYGTVYGNWDEDAKTKISLQTIVEKPSIKYAKENLLIDGKFYGNFGEVILNKELFDVLEEIVSLPIKEGEEYQLMDAFEKVIQRGHAKGIVINGKSYDAGNIEAYINVMRKF